MQVLLRSCSCSCSCVCVRMTGKTGNDRQSPLQLLRNKEESSIVNVADDKTALMSRLEMVRI